MLIYSLQRFVSYLTSQVMVGVAKKFEQEKMSPKKFMQSETQRKKIHTWQSAQPLCTSIKKWSKRSKADYNLRSGPIFAVLIHFLLRSLFSFRLARRIGPILPRTHRAWRKFLCSCYQLYALVGPPGFCFIYFYIHVIRHLLTYSLTYRYLLSCAIAAIVCVLLCLFVCLFVFFFCFWSDLGWFCDPVLCH